MRDRLDAGRTSPLRHPTADQIAKFAEGLEVAQEAELLLHFVVCDACRQQLEERRRFHQTPRLVKADPTQPTESTADRTAAFEAAKLRAARGESVAGSDVWVEGPSKSSSDARVLSRRANRVIVGVAVALAASIALLVFARSGSRSPSDVATSKREATTGVAGDFITKLPTRTHPTDAGIDTLPRAPHLPAVVARNPSLPLSPSPDSVRRDNVRVVADVDTVKPAAGAVMASPTAEKRSIVVYPFTISNDVDASARGVGPEAARGAVEGLVSSGGFAVLDRTSEENPQAQLNSAGTASRFDGLAAAIKQRQEPAKYVLVGHISRAELQPPPTEQRGTSAYTATLELTVSVVNVENGAIVATKAITVTGGASRGIEQCSGSGSARIRCEAAKSQAQNVVAPAGVTSPTAIDPSLRRRALTAATTQLKDVVARFAADAFVNRPPEPTRVASRDVLPRVLVIPATKGNEDIRTVLEADVQRRVAVAKFKEAFDRAGYGTADFPRTLSALANDAAVSLASQADLKSMVIEQSRADLYVEVDVSRANETSANGLALTATSYLAQGGDPVVNRAMPLPPLSSANAGYEMLVDRVLHDDFDSFRVAIQEKFNSYVEDGIPLRFVISVAPGGALLSRSVDANGTHLADAIEDWFQRNAFKGRYRLSAETPQRLVASDVRMALLDPTTGRSSSLPDFVLGLQRYLRTLNVRVRRSSVAGTVYLEIQ